MHEDSEAVRAALDHLHQDSFLAVSPVADWLPDVAAASDPRLKAQLLRRNLLDAIELLRPTRPLPFGSREARSYEVLTLRYVEGTDSTEMADELGVSERQVYRDLRRALEALVPLLRPAADSGPSPGDDSGQPRRPEDGALEEEMQRVVLRPRKLDLRQLLSSTVQSLEPLAARFGVTLDWRPPAELPPLSADEGLLRQTLAQLLSLGVQSASEGRLEVTARFEESAIAVVLRFTSTRETLDETLLAPVRLLADLQRLSLAVDTSPDGSTSLLLLGRAAEPKKVLVIEDNEGAIELYRRYLAQSDEWQLSGATDPRVSLDIARQTQPAVIILDIMMPRQDGWSVLQALRADPATAAIPVVVCSIFADPELASALGADAYVRKPVSRVQLLKALQEAVARRGASA